MVIYERSTHKRPGFIPVVGEEVVLTASQVSSLMGVLHVAPLVRMRHGQEGPGPWALPLVSFF